MLARPLWRHLAQRAFSPLHFCVPCQCPWCTVAHRWWRSASGIAGVADGRARASIAVLCFARGARGARASQCRCACYAYFVLTYGNSVCGRIRHRMSAGGARTPRTRVFFASVVGNVSVIGNRISVIARFGYRPRAPLNIPTSPHGLCAQVQDVCYPPHQQSHVSHTQHAPGPGAITKKVATPMRTGKACR